MPSEQPDRNWWPETLTDIFEELVRGSGARGEITISRGYGEVEVIKNLVEDVMKGKTTEEE